jgi:hypothetical protein
MIKFAKILFIIVVVFPFALLKAQESDSLMMSTDTLHVENDTIQGDTEEMPFTLSTLESDSLILAMDNTQLGSKELNDQTSHPLKPPNTESPRATLQNFINAINRSYRLVNKGYNLSVQEPGWNQSD